MTRMKIVTIDNKSLCYFITRQVNHNTPSLFQAPRWWWKVVQ